MAEIRVLPETVQNKIAAGEVIERPASVVKELVENAMDAGAVQVSVELEEGGHRLIRVSDDGSGMDEADLVASLGRHATSKIRDVDDIFNIATFGFRGEALPSIGSVSRMAIATCLRDAAEGHEILVEGGRTVRLSPAPPRKGTRIEVRDIFFNTPARRKFLRNPSSEGTRTGEVLTRLALGNPHVGFRLQIGDRITLAVKPAATQLDRIGDIFGRETASRLVPFSGDIADGLAVTGFFARPPESRRNSTGIYVLVNRRWIKYYGLAKAVADAFHGTLPPREYPFAVINLEVDPARVDLNVHPAKEEVRFEQERLLISGVRRAIRAGLESVASVPTVVNLTAETPGMPAPFPERSPTPFPPPAMPSGNFAASSSRPASPEQGKFGMASEFARPRNRDFSGIDLAAARDRLRGGESVPASGSSPIQPDAGDKAGISTESPAVSQTAGNDVAVGAVGQHRILGQAGGKYIVVDGPEGLLLVDPHALHERWNFDRLREERGKAGIAQRLLLPLELHLSPSEAAAAVEALPNLAEYGFAFTLPEPTRLVVTEAPSFVPAAKLENLIRQVLDDVADADTTLASARERLLASLACRSSVLLGKALPEEDMLLLLDRFFKLGQLPTCPHGRPTAIRIGWEELGRRFGR